MGRRPEVICDAERGYDGDVVRQYRLGWAPEGRDELVRSLGVPASALVDAGLATVDESGRYTDFFRGRLLFPIFEAGGRPVGAGGRLLPGGRGPKYKNTPGTAVYDKSRVLYGLNWAKKAVVAAGRVVVCEGYTDVIGLQRAGIGEAVATCGTALAEGHIRLLTNFARQIVLAYDADAAGQAAAERFYEWERRFDVDIRVAALPAGADPADLAQRDPDALAARRGRGPALPGLPAGPAVRPSRSARTPEGRARAAAEAMAMVAEHPNELVRDQYLMQVADRCRLEPDRLRQMALAPVPPRGGGLSRSRSGATRPGSGPEARFQPNRPAPGLWKSRRQPTVSGPELEALRLAVHHPEQVADRLELVLFAHPLARACFDALSASTTLHDAIEAADPQAADLLQRLAVEDTDAEVDDVMVRLVRAGRPAAPYVSWKPRCARPTPAEQAAFVPTVTWLKLTLETLRAEDRASPPGRVGSRTAVGRLAGGSR